MSGSEILYLNEEHSDKKIDKKPDVSDSGTVQSGICYTTESFVANFVDEGQRNIVCDCIQELQNDIQLKIGFDNLLKSGISYGFVNKIKQELEENIKAGLDEETLKFLLVSLIAETIEGGFQIGSSYYNDTMYQIEEDEVTALEDEATALEDEATALEVEATALEDEVTVVQNENSMDIMQENKDISTIMFEALKEREDLLRKNPGIDDNKIQEKVKSVQIPEGTRRQLEERYDKDFVDNYILLRVTVDEIKNNPDWNVNETDFKKFEENVNKLSSFDIFLKNLDNACNIPDTSLSSFSSKNISQTRTELFDQTIGNKNLCKVRDNNITSHEGIYKEMFPEKMEEGELIEQYGKFLDGDLREFLDQYQNNFQIKLRINNIIDTGIPYNLTEYDTWLVDNYKVMISELEGIKKEMETGSKNMIEELCMTSQIKGFLGCIPEEYASDFQFNKSREITFGNDGVLQLNGHINGVNFSLKHDTKDKDAHLQTLTTLFRDGNELSLRDNYANSPFILPSGEKVFNVALSAVRSDDLSKIENKDDYFSTLENLILKNMDELYADTKYTHHFIKNQIKNEEIIHETESIISNFGGLKANLSKTDRSLYDFFDTLQFNLENMSYSEKENFLTCIKELGRLVSEYVDTTNSGESNALAENYGLLKMLGSKDLTLDVLGGKNVDENKKSFFDFFSFFCGDSNGLSCDIINVQQLEMCIDDPEYAFNYWKEKDPDSWMDMMMKSGNV